MTVDLRQLDPDIQIPQPGEAGRRGVTVFLMGDLGTYKTSWAATWPSPLVWGFMHEGGDMALDHVPRLYGVPPVPRIPITNLAQFNQKVMQFPSFYKQAGITTLIIDPINGYQDLWMSELIALRKHKAKSASATTKERERAAMTPTSVAKLDQQDWGFLYNNIAFEIMKPLHALPDLNVIWICHVDDEFEGEGEHRRKIGVKPLLQGKIRKVLPRQCSLFLHAKKEKVFDKGVKFPREAVHFYIERDADVSTGLRHRFADMLPTKLPYLQDPRPGVGDLPTYFALEYYIGKHIAGGTDWQGQNIQNQQAAQKSG